MKNTNILTGFICPSCSSIDEFRIQISTICTFRDSGAGDTEDLEWESTSYCQCTECDHEGIVSDFCKDNSPQ